MFTFIVRTLWILLMTVPLAVAAFEIPGFTSYHSFAGLGTKVSYLFSAAGLAGPIAMLFLACSAARGSAEALKNLGEMISHIDNATYKARLYTSAMVLSTIILLLAVDSTAAAVVIAVVSLVCTLVRGHAESVYSKLKLSAYTGGAVNRDTVRARRNLM